MFWCKVVVLEQTVVQPLNLIDIDQDKSWIYTCISNICVSIGIIQMLHITISCMKDL